MLKIYSTRGQLPILPPGTDPRPNGGAYRPAVGVVVWILLDHQGREAFWPVGRDLQRSRPPPGGGWSLSRVLLRLGFDQFEESRADSDFDHRAAARAVCPAGPTATGGRVYPGRSCRQAPLTAARVERGECAVPEEPGRRSPSHREAWKVAEWVRLGLEGERVRMGRLGRNARRRM